jgi:hypothetical protein
VGPEPEENQHFEQNMVAKHWTLGSALPRFRFPDGVKKLRASK